MKRWIACLLTMALCAGMTACGGQDITLEGERARGRVRQRRLRRER